MRPYELATPIQLFNADVIHTSDTMDGSPCVRFVDD